MMHGRSVLRSLKDAIIKNENSFLYKGYYYDVETGLYLLTTRYYDPKIGRFITTDDISYLDPESIGGLNLYAYCLNNPVMCLLRTRVFYIKIKWRFKITVVK